jgi:subtilase family serine protease
MPRSRLLAQLLSVGLISLLAACNSTASGTHTPTPQGTATSTLDKDICPSLFQRITNCYTPHKLRTAYHIDTLTQQGFTGKGQTVVVIVSYGSPTIQADLDHFSDTYGLPHTTVQVKAPIGSIPFDSTDTEQSEWAGETTLDVETIHSLAPEANIVVLTSPVDETEGTAGIPEFLQLEQYAHDNHLGQIVSQSWGASEVSFDANGKTVLQQFCDFYHTATTQDNITFLTGSGDLGATDYIDPQRDVSSTRTTGFPSDCPWVTSVGGTTLQSNGNNNFTETAWQLSGGGISTIFGLPDYQQNNLPSSIIGQLNGGRAVPDVAADADPRTALAIYENGNWSMVGGTSASTPLWAGLIAVANQKAGHPLGFINSAIYTLGKGHSYSQDFRDVTVGDNSYQNIQGFPAQPGYDLVTGWGSPLADKFIPDLIAAKG